MELRLVTCDSNSEDDVPTKEKLEANIVLVSCVKRGNPSAGISPTIPHNSGGVSSYSLSLTRKREWTKSTPPAPETTAKTMWSEPAERRETSDDRNESIWVPESAVAPTSMSKPARERLPSSEEGVGGGGWLST